MPSFRHTKQTSKNVADTNLWPNPSKIFKGCLPQILLGPIKFLPEPTYSGKLMSVHEKSLQHLAFQAAFITMF